MFLLLSFFFTNKWYLTDKWLKNSMNISFFSLSFFLFSVFSPFRFVSSQSSIKENRLFFSFHLYDLYHWVSTAVYLFLLITISQFFFPLVFILYKLEEFKHSDKDYFIMFFFKKINNKKLLFRGNEGYIMIITIKNNNNNNEVSFTYLTFLSLSLSFSCGTWRPS